MKNISSKIYLVFLLTIFPFTVGATTIILEAEAGELMNSASIVNSSVCSGGRKVGNLGDAARNGGVKFTFQVKTGGSYRVDMYYLAGEARNFNFTLNDNAPVVLNCLSTGSWDYTGLKSISVMLQTGENSLIIDNNAGWAPDLDMVIITPVKNIQSSEDAKKTFTLSRWKISVDTTTGNADIFYNGNPALIQNHAAFSTDSGTFFSDDLFDFSVTQKSLTDGFGEGKQIQITGRSIQDNFSLTHNYYLYKDLDYFLTDISIASDTVLSSNYLAPIYSDSTVMILPEGNNACMWVPFDNDKWIRYQTYNFGIPITSYEVSALINKESRNGIVVGSVEHDTWKTGIRITTSAGNEMTRLEVFGGETSNESRDNLPHGKVKAHVIRSPRMMFGRFSDWRVGMQTYGDANAIIAPKLPWTHGKPFGWNSWGAIQTNLSYTNASEVSQYFQAELQPRNFQNDSTVYIGLDSYWDNITYSNLVKFVKECKSRGQNAGIYWTPFVDWAKNPDRVVEGSNGVYYKDIYLYANGKPQEIAGAYAIDPTHPATKKRMDTYLDRFIAQGFTYLKLDFMTHGSLEADSHYDPDVFTGIQAYNQGMQYLVNHLNGRMFLNLSISPLFPSQYAHSRRIACDAYGSIKDSEYTLNSLTYGWWLDHAYTYNDGDNVVFNGFSTGENRVRVTSSVITGLFIIGDDYSQSGYSSAKTRAQAFLTNAEINRIARMSKSFYPVETSSGSASTDMFIQQIADTLYLAVFNFSDQTISKTVDFNRIPLVKGTTYVIHELWDNTKENRTDSWIVSIPRRDVKFFKIYAGYLPTATQLNKKENSVFYPNPCRDILYISNPETFGSDTNIIAYNLTGQIVLTAKASNDQISMTGLEKGLYLLSVVDQYGQHFSTRIIKE